jgi:hypothetical protein
LCVLLLQEWQATLQSTTRKRRELRDNPFLFRGMVLSLFLLPKSFYVFIDFNSQEKVSGNADDLDRIFFSAFSIEDHSIALKSPWFDISQIHRGGIPDCSILVIKGEIGNHVLNWFRAGIIGITGYHHISLRPPSEPVMRMKESREERRSKWRNIRLHGFQKG